MEMLYKTQRSVVIDIIKMVVLKKSSTDFQMDLTLNGMIVMIERK